MDEESNGVDTSTNDVAVDTTAAESPTTEEVSAEVEDTESANASTGQQEDVGGAEETEAGDGAELKPKSQNRFQKLANENRGLRERVAELEQLAVPTEQDYIDGGYDGTEAKLNALEARIQQRDAVESITNLNHSVDSDMARILHEYPELDPSNTEKFNKDLAIDLFSQFDRDSGAQYTQDGILLQTNQLPYQYIKDKMQLIEKASAKARVSAQKAVESMVASAETTSSAAPKVSKDAKDKSIEELEAELGIVYQ